MDFGDVVNYLFQSNMDDKYVRIYENTGNEYQGKVVVIKFKSKRFGKETDYCEIRIENGKDYLIYIDDIQRVEIVDDLMKTSMIKDISKCCKAVYGKQSDKWWIEDTFNDCYIELPRVIIEKINIIRGMEAQADIINEFISTNPKWLYEEEYSYSKNWFDI